MGSETRGATAILRYEPELLTTSEDLRSAIRRHPSGFNERMLRAHSPNPGLLSLAGEVDATNDHLLAELLAAAVQEADAELVVDCEQLKFMSVAAWRSVVTMTEDYRAGGGRVRLASLPRIAARLLHLTGYIEVFEMDRSHERRAPVRPRRAAVRFRRGTGGRQPGGARVTLLCTPGPDGDRAPAS